MKADLAIVVAYGQIIPKEFLNLTKKGFINIHGSILLSGEYVPNSTFYNEFR